MPRVSGARLDAPGRAPGPGPDEPRAPASDANGRAWRAAVPCTAPVDPARANDCLVTAHAVIDRFETGRRKSGHMYFTGGRPVERTDVGSGATGLFRVGDEVELTFWRGEVMTVTGAGQVWNRYVPSPGPTALPAARLAVLAGYPMRRLRPAGAGAYGVAGQGPRAERAGGAALRATTGA
ncbi:hypothetical protein [Streptomyces sp. NPDC058872]|uniref:hypothetical protein n=1 Tax=Streptomyces sp. NPDC058872 TaxID=3346661 RepID=UPI0036977063